MNKEVITDPAELTSRNRQPLWPAAHSHHDLTSCELLITDLNGVGIHEFAPARDQFHPSICQGLDVDAVEPVHLLAHVLQQH